MVPRRFKERKIRDVDGDWFSTGLVEDEGGGWVPWGDVVKTIAGMAIALDMAQAVIRKGKLDKDVVLREIDENLENISPSMELINTDDKEKPK